MRLNKVEKIDVFSISKICMQVIVVYLKLININC